MRHSGPFLRAAVVASVTMLMSCTGDSTSGVQSFANGVTVSLTTTDLKVGQTIQAAARDAYGGALIGTAPKWTSSNPAVAAISTSGLITAVAPGIADIIGDVSGHKASATVTVRAVPASISLSFPPSARVGQTVAARALAVDSAGAVLPNREFTWSSSDVAVATISATGTITAVNPGTTTITATTDSVSGRALFTVAAPQAATVAVTLGAARLTAGRTTPAAAAVEDSAGNVIPDRTITWSTSDAAVATVSSSGEVHAVSPGAALVTAVSDGVVGTAELTVTGIPTALLVTTQPSSTAPSGALLARQPVVELRDASNNPVLSAGVAAECGDECTRRRHV
jgi:uncharacterized protein YjdB